MCFAFHISVVSSSNIYANPLGGTEEFKAFKNACQINLRCISQQYPFTVCEYLFTFASLLEAKKIKLRKFYWSKFMNLGTAFAKWTFGKMQMSLCIHWKLFSLYLDDIQISRLHQMQQCTQSSIRILSLLFVATERECWSPKNHAAQCSLSVVQMSTLIYILYLKPFSIASRPHFTLRNYSKKLLSNH